MSTTALIVIVVAVLAVAGLVGYAMQRRVALRKRFGPEYEEAVRAAGSPLRAEAQLEARAKRVQHYEIRPLAAEERNRFVEAWRQLQSRFVDNPAGSVAEADRLVTDLMATRGYPMTEFDRQAEDLSVDHPAVVSHYRAAHRIAVDQGRRDISTEDLRQAVKHYRILFEDLLGTSGSRRAHA
jgi:hypothetical protein